MTNIDPEAVAANLTRVQGEIAVACGHAGRDPNGVEVLAAVKYLDDDELPLVAQSGIESVGENRVQDLVRRQDSFGELFSWQFIGQLQSRKVSTVVSRVSRIHSLASSSALNQLARSGQGSTEVFLQANLSLEAGKAGILAADLDGFLERASEAKVVFSGLTTMPPPVANAEQNRRFFFKLRELAEQLTERWQPSHTFDQLSMGTSQDYLVAVEEGATVVRLGSTLWKSSCG